MTVTPETMDKLIKSAESVVKVSSGSATELMAEAINLFIIDSVLSVLKVAVVFILFYIVKRYCQALLVGAKEADKKVFKAFETATLICSLVYFTGASFPHLQNITKALVAPKLFLLERATTLMKDKK